MGWAEKIQGAVSGGIEDAAATIAGPFVPLLSELPALIGIVGDQVVQHLDPLRRAALVYELRYVEEICTALWNEFNELGGEHALEVEATRERARRLKARLESYGMHAEALRDLLWPEAHVTESEVDRG